MEDGRRARPVLSYATPQPLLHGLHERDWRYLPGGPADFIPLRVDGSLAATGEPATTSLRLLITENSQHSLANSRKHALHEDAARFSDQPFVSRFAKSNNEASRRSPPWTGSRSPSAPVPARHRVPEWATNGARVSPGKASARQAAPRRENAQVHHRYTRRHWPLAEGEAGVGVASANPPLSCPPMRLMYTENEHLRSSTMIDA